MLDLCPLPLEGRYQNTQTLSGLNILNRFRNKYLSLVKLMSEVFIILKDQKLITVCMWECVDMRVIMIRILLGCINSPDLIMYFRVGFRIG